MATIVTNDKGIASITDLPLGKYYLVETKTIEGFVLDSTPIDADLSYIDQDTKVVYAGMDVTNERQKVSITVMKKDAEDGKALEGAIFGLFAKEDILNADGKVVVKADSQVERAVSGKDGKTTAKATAKTATSVATTTATTAAGTALAPGVGTAIGLAAGYAAGVAVEQKDAKITSRSRMLKFFMDKMKAQDNQSDSVAKLVKDLITTKLMLWVKTVAPIVGLFLLLIVIIVGLVAGIVMAVIAVIYNSPFALFLPPLESGDTVQTVASAYVAEFNRDVGTLANNHTGYDEGQIVYVDYEGTDANPSNYYDILAVYMVKYGVGDTAVVMNDTSKGWLQTVVNDMCSYTTSTGTETVTSTDAQGNTTTTTKSVLYVNVTLKSYRDMISVYGLDSNQVEMLEQMMSPEFMGQLGYTGGAGGGGPGVSSLTEEEINGILASITDNTQKTACSYALHRVGYPYSQDYRDTRT